MSKVYDNIKRNVLIQEQSMAYIHHNLFFKNENISEQSVISKSCDNNHAKQNDLI